MELKNLTRGFQQKKFTNSNSDSEILTSKKFKLPKIQELYTQPVDSTSSSYLIKASSNLGNHTSEVPLSEMAVSNSGSNRPVSKSSSNSPVF